MAEYRKKMARRTSEPLQQENLTGTGPEQKASNNPFRDEPTPK